MGPPGRYGVGMIRDHRLTIYAILLILGSTCTDGCRPPRRPDVLEPPYVPQIEWPPSAPVDLDVEIIATAADENDDGIPDIEIPGDHPGFQVTKGRLEGFQYLEVIIGVAAPDAELPMVMAIHGRGDKPRIPGGPFLGLDHPIRVILPRAPTPLDSGFEWLPVRVGEGKTDVLTSSLWDMAERLASLIVALRNKYPTVGKAIVTGFSQGGLLAFTLGVHYPDIVHAALPNAGWLPPNLIPESIYDPTGYPWIRSTHGTDDMIITIEPTRKCVEMLEALGLDVELVEFEGVRHVMNEEMNALFHEWLERAVFEIVGPAQPAGDGDSGTEGDSLTISDVSELELPGDVHADVSQ